MKYGYTVINTDGYAIALKRGVAYVALLAAIIAAALTVLFILFELYLWLILCGSVFLLVLIVFALLGRKSDRFIYTFSEVELIVRAKNGKTVRFDLAKPRDIKIAEKSAFFKKEILELTFNKNRVVMENKTNENSKEVGLYLFSYENKVYLVTLDDYSLSMFLRREA